MRSGAVIFLPPSRCVAPEARQLAPRLVGPEARNLAEREAGPRHWAARPPGLAAFGPPPAARVAGPSWSRCGSLRLADDGQQVAGADLVAWPGADLGDRPRLGRG